MGSGCDTNRKQTLWKGLTTAAFKREWAACVSEHDTDCFYLTNQRDEEAFFISKKQIN